MTAPKFARATGCLHEVCKFHCANPLVDLTNRWHPSRFRLLARSRLNQATDRVVILAAPVFHKLTQCSKLSSGRSPCEVSKLTTGEISSSRHPNTFRLLVGNRLNQATDRVVILAGPKFGRDFICKLHEAHSALWAYSASRLMTQVK